MSKIIAFQDCFSLLLLSLALLNHCPLIHIKCDLLTLSLGRDTKTEKGYCPGGEEGTSCQKAGQCWRQDKG